MNSTLFQFKIYFEQNVIFDYDKFKFKEDR